MINNINAEKNLIITEGNFQLWAIKDFLHINNATLPNVGKKQAIHRTYNFSENNSVIKLLTQRLHEVAVLNSQMPLTLDQIPHKLKHHSEYENG